MADRPTFEIGLTMAGAISAGAYTAGVIDFLFEALDAIDDVRAGRDTSYLTAGLAGENPIIDPPHDVRISTMSGTSAGSMVTAIVATILGTRVRPVTSDRQVRADDPTGNPLYDAWVREIHYDKLLSTTDLDGGQYVLSMLNADELGKIVARTLRYAKTADYVRSYIADPLPIYFCISNLRGVRYSFQLDVDSGVANEYQMSLHADWMGFNWTRNAGESPGLITVMPAKTPDEWQVLGDAALASGAFPVGLAARTLKRKFNDYEDRTWFVPGDLLPPVRREENGRPVEPADAPKSWESRVGDYRIIPPLDTDQDFPNGYQFVNVDGGIFDNEPLELARRALAGPRQRNPRDPREADRSVILIDPFPNVFPLDKSFDPQKKRGLLTVISDMFSAMVAQARFKLDELALANDPNVASRKAIMPIRYDANDNPEKYAIACGSLNGFGGFLSKEFRHHDYMLGRRNCQRFLSHHLVLPADPGVGAVNDLFAGWTNPQHREKFAVKRELDINGQKRQVIHLPVVPLLGKLAADAYTKMPPWPAHPADLHRDALKQAVIKRADALKNSLFAQYEPSPVLKTGINVYWAWRKSDWVDTYAIQKVSADLQERGISLS